MTLIELTGTALSILGCLFSIYGSYLCNQWKDLTGARIFWTISNPLMLVWVIGYIYHVWDGQLPLWAMAGLYGFYCCSSVYGWIKK